MTHTVSLAVDIFYVIFLFFFFKLLVLISICFTERPNCVLVFVFFVCVFGCVCVLAMLHGIWDLISLPRMELVPLAVEAWSPNHCTAREFSMLCFRTDPYVLYFTVFPTRPNMVSLTQ